MLIQYVLCNENDKHTTSKLDYVLQHILYNDSVDQIENNDVIIDIGVNKPYTQSQLTTFIDLYVSGVQAYLNNDWNNCIDDIETALLGYKDYYEVFASCRINCEYEDKRISPFFEENIENLHYYESIVRKTLCMEKCKRKLMPTLPEYFYMNNWARNSFAARKPYEYLQLCYYHVSIIKFNIIMMIIIIIMVTMTSYLYTLHYGTTNILN